MTTKTATVISGTYRGETGTVVYERPGTIMLDLSGQHESFPIEMVRFYETPQPQPQEFPEISSGLGVGGIGSDDYSIHTETPAPYVRSAHKCGRGQRYDERCAGCGRITAICNDCELCSRCHEAD